MPILVCYDITHDGLRQQVATKLLQCGLERINRSVFLGAPDDGDLKEMKAAVADLMSAKAQPSDSVIWLPLTAHQVMRVQVLGLNLLKPEELSGLSHTLVV